jgi:hypothetical protein
MPGDIVHMDGRVLGSHEGVTRYTIGQRRGLNIAVGDPLFVVRIDADKRQVIVGPREALLTASLVAEGRQLAGRRGQPGGRRRRWRAGAGPRALDPRTRPGRLALVDGEARLVFDVLEEGVAPGQACVLYDPADPERVLGGGFIAHQRDSGSAPPCPRAAAAVTSHRQTRRSCRSRPARDGRGIRTLRRTGRPTRRTAGLRRHSADGALRRAGSISLTEIILPTLRAKNSTLSNTPSTTPLARSWVASTVRVVASMTIVDCTGIERSFRTELQSKVVNDTMIITATRAAIGIRATQSRSTRIRISRNSPAQKVDSRPSPAGLHVDDRLADQRAAGHAAQQGRDDVGDALPARLAVLVRRTCRSCRPAGWRSAGIPAGRRRPRSATPGR